MNTFQQKWLCVITVKLPVLWCAGRFHSFSIRAMALTLGTILKLKKRRILPYADVIQEYLNYIV